MRVLVVNAGSSSVKLRLLGADDTVLASHDVPISGGRVDRPRFEAILRDLPAPDAVGHRVVHGGRWYRGAVRLTDDVVSRLEQLVELAPLHQPLALAGIEMSARVLPGIPGVACFDTGFHAHMPAASATYPLPASWRDAYGLRRYGFHGLSHAYATTRVAQLLGGLPDKLVVCHLGAGASLAAVAQGRSVDTTMGFTPLEGLMMATRSGSVDPGLLVWLQQQAGMPLAELADGLEHRSGLLGLAGTADMREVVTRAGTGDERAGLALDVYVHKLRAGIAAMAAPLGGLDALVFTGGVGERAALVRRLAADGLAFLGVGIDDDINDTAEPDVEITGADARVRTLVLTSREDLRIAAEVRSVPLGRPARPDAP